MSNIINTPNQQFKLYDPYDVDHIRIGYKIAGYGNGLPLMPL